MSNETENRKTYKEQSIEEIKRDISFLLGFVPALKAEEVVEGLCSSFYFTGSYKDDVVLVSRIETIVESYNINTDDVEDLA